jgi:hypothetical protein
VLQSVTRKNKKRKTKMKKTLIMMAAAVSAIAINAASVDWELDFYDVSGMDDTTAYTLYVFAGGDVASTLATALNTSGSFNETAFASALAGATKVTGSFDEYGWASGSLAGAESAISFLVLTDGTVTDSTFYYSGSIDVTGYTYEPPAGSPGGLYTDFSAMSSGTIGATAAVPEPTSGLLMLVGLAGLALRRRRA